VSITPPDAVGTRNAKEAAKAFYDAICEFGDGSNMFFDWSAFTKGTRKLVKELALDKLGHLEACRDTWSNKLYKVQFFTAQVDNQDTLWLAVDCDHGKHAYVFTMDGKKALASAFMPETGDSFSWTRGFRIDPYLEHVVVKSNSSKR
jgi:hypothetical protein